MTSLSVRILNHLRAKGLRYQSKILLYIIFIGLILVATVSILSLNGIQYSYETLPKKSECLSKIESVREAYVLTINALELATTRTEIDIISSRFNIRYKYLHGNLVCTKPHHGGFLDMIQGMYMGIFLYKMRDHIKDLEQSLTSNIARIKILLRVTYNELYYINSKAAALALLQDKLNLINIYVDDIKRINTHLISSRDTLIMSLYRITIVLLVVLIAIIMVFTLILSSIILRSITTINEGMARMVAEKTQELVQLNASLEVRIADEIVKSREKDKILYNQSRLVAMGEMLQNIAHQWRQPLNALIILIQSFKVKLDNGKLTEDFVLKQIRHGLKIANNMSDTIENFRSYFQDNTSKKEFNIVTCVKNCLFLIRPHLKASNINIVFKASNDIVINSYESIFTQVLMNVLLNARDAMVDAPSRYIMITVHRGDGCIKIAIKDSGGGIRFANLSRVFEPYFTTKHKEVGTGIGLYMSQQMVEKRLHGSIEVENVNWTHSQGEFTGALFTITLPYEVDG